LTTLPPSPKASRWTSSVLTGSVVLAALGYFVDIYDLVLFSIVRVQSLKDLGIPAAELMDKGVLLLNTQMIGMLIGGILWGVLGDKKGRLAVLFGSIIMYSLANLANGMVQNIEQYMILRFIAGIGLAGELGAGITLVTEVLPKEKRGYGTMIVATIGAMGALLAGFIADPAIWNGINQQFGWQLSGWRMAYFIGGGLGIGLLVLRIRVYESGLFRNLEETVHVSRGNFLSLFTNRQRFVKYLMCILVGLPIWYVVGVLITFSPEFGRTLGLPEEVKTNYAIFACYGGLTVGDFLSGWLSQKMKSRRWVVKAFLVFSVFIITTYLLCRGVPMSVFYMVCFGLGLSTGFWAVFVTIAAEQFGTNLRATVTTTVPNFVRGAVVPMTLTFTALQPALGLRGSAAALGILILFLSRFAIGQLKESYHTDLDYFEE
jgi:putative MFS transporter